MPAHAQFQRCRHAPFRAQRDPPVAALGRPRTTAPQLRAPARSARRLRARVEPVQVGNTPGEWLIPEGADENRVLYYLHGGAFIACSAATHRESIARIAHAAGMRALAIDYRLAPEHPFPAALDDSIAGYRFLLAIGRARRNRS